MRQIRVGKFPKELLRVKPEHKFGMYHGTRKSLRAPHSKINLFGETALVQIFPNDVVYAQFDNWKTEMSHGWWGPFHKSEWNLDGRDGT